MIGKSTILAAGTALALALPAGAATVTIVKDGSIVTGAPTLHPHVVFGSTGNVSTGEVSPETPPVGRIVPLDGILVTAGFSGGSQASQTWITSPTNTNCGWANTTEFILASCNDTYTNPWTLTNNTNSAIEWLEIDLRPAGMSDYMLWFDTVQPNPGTDDSFRGRGFALVGDSLDLGGNVTATYTVMHGDQIGDAWRVLNVDFTGLEDGGMTGQLQFRQDVDFSIIPVPAALPLLITALGLLSLFRRRREAA